MAAGLAGVRARVGRGWGIAVAAWNGGGRDVLMRAWVVPGLEGYI